VYSDEEVYIPKQLQVVSYLHELRNFLKAWHLLISVFFSIGEISKKCG